MEIAKLGDVLTALHPLCMSAATCCLAVLSLKPPSLRRTKPRLSGAALVRKDLLRLLLHFQNAQEKITHLGGCNSIAHSAAADVEMQSDNWGPEIY